MNDQTKLLIAEYKRRLAIMEAATPHNVEYQDQTHQDLVWQHTSRPIWNWVNCDYRIKPEPKYRAWTIDEVPVGAVVRRKPTKAHGVGDRVTIIGTSDDKVHCGDSIHATTCKELLQEAEVSYDFGKTWQPCGVLES